MLKGPFVEKLKESAGANDFDLGLEHKSYAHYEFQF